MEANEGGVLSRLLDSVPTVAEMVDLMACPPYAPSLLPEQEFAVLLHALCREGYSDRSNGHVTVKVAPDRLLTNPFGIAWDEICASDVICVDFAGKRISGAHPVSPALPLHLELHKLRPEVHVTIHNHPEFSTMWACAHRVPPAYEQTGALLVDDEVVLIDEYGGGVSSRSLAEKAARAMGAGWVGLLAHHGVFVLGESVPRAFMRAIYLEVRSRYAWRMLSFPTATALPRSAQQALIELIWNGAGVQPGLWEEAVRRAIRTTPEVIT